jgi:hypothetical protein
MAALLAALTPALVGVLAVPALSQTPEDDIIGVAYQSADGGVETITAPVLTSTGTPTATVLVPDAEYSAEDNSFASLEDGSAFVVTPTIDPELRLFYNLTNLSDELLTSLTFTLESAPDFYFDSQSGFEPRSSRFTGVFAEPLDGSRTRFRSLIFTTSSGFNGLTIGSSEQFSFAINVPGTIGKSYGVQLRANGEPELPFSIAATAPEPGSASLLVLAGAVCLPIAGLKVRRRLARNPDTT